MDDDTEDLVDDNGAHFVYVAEAKPLPKPVTRNQVKQVSRPKRQGGRPVDKGAVVAKYRELGSFECTREHFHIAGDRLRKILVDAGALIPRRKKTVPPEVRQAIVRQYNAGNVTMSAIAEQHGISTPTVSRIVNRNASRNNED